MRLRHFLLCIVAAMLLAAPAMARAQAPAAPAQPSVAETTEKGLDALKANQPQQALDLFEQALKSNPNDIAANLLAATAALNLYKGDLAVKYTERARDLDPNNWKVHTTLVAAYAAAGKKEQRDQERETLRKLHDDPRAPDAMQTKGFLLEMFPVKQYKVEAIEYFHPVDKFHIYYRFLIRNTTGKRVWKIDVESNDFDQNSWAKAHPDDAAAGKRQFQLVGEDRTLHADYGMLSGTADYDTMRARVVEVIQEQTATFPGEAAQ